LHCYLSGTCGVHGHILDGQLPFGHAKVHVPERHTNENPIRQGRTASKQVKVWNFSGVQELARKRGIEWHLVPTGGQHFNGQAERMIGVLKKQVSRSFEGKNYKHEETCTILQEAAQIVNSCYIVAGPWAEKEPLCPENLMLGRAVTGIPSVSLETDPQVIKRFCVVQ
jgi:hypothetical protein